MRVVRLRIDGFRGFDIFTMHPRAHAVVVGEPRAGRTDLVEALRRVLSPDPTAAPLADDLDFHGRDTTRRIEIEVVLGDLGPALEQELFSQLEVWDAEARDLVDELDAGGPLQPSQEWVARLCYRAVWSQADEQARHWVDFPKLSDPTADAFEQVPRRLLADLPFAVAAMDGRVLSLAARATFRTLVERAPGTGFPGAVNRLRDRLSTAAADFSGIDQLAAALDATLAPIRGSFQLDDGQAADAVRFLPEGGSLAGVLRSLRPALDLGPPGHLPIWRHGSTLEASLRVAEVIATGSASGAVIAIDDFGEGLDADTARHLASTLRNESAQAWLSTRRPSVAQAFNPGEIIRLTCTADGHRQLHQLIPPATRAERVAAQHLNIQVLPAMTSRSVVVVEGPHDKAALDALAERIQRREGVPLPAARGVALIDAAAADRSGGSSGVVRLAGLAKAFGFHTVVVIDGDTGSDAEQVLANALAAADAVVRLPHGHAIEKALVVDVDEDVVRGTLQQLETEYDVRLPARLDELTGARLVEAAVEAIKSSGGLHAQFIELLPGSLQPPLARRLLDTAVAAAADRKTGHEQL
jgi:putative ATP-dependent endonuclease of OLD family